jgi:hypothetical protein
MVERRMSSTLTSSVFLAAALPQWQSSCPYLFNTSIRELSKCTYGCDRNQS